eukprot:1156573-Pelagomonas_calceolata.AAC.2
MARLVEGTGSIDSPTHTQKDFVETFGTSELSSRTCSLLQLTLVHKFDVVRLQAFLLQLSCPCRQGKSDQDSIGAAGGPSSLIRNAGVKEVGRYNTVGDLLSDVQVVMSQMVCAAYIHM